MNKYLKVYIQYEFTLDSIIKIGTGVGANEYIDNALRRTTLADGTEQFEIPGTSVKGKIRATYEKIEHLFNGTKEQNINIFGTTGKAGWAHFSSLVPKKPVDVGIMTNNSVDRFRKAIKTYSLRVEEYGQLKQGDQCVGTIEGYILNEKQKKEVYGLLLALLNTSNIGGRKSVGYGQGKVTVVKCQIGENEIPPSNIKEILYENLK